MERSTILFVDYQVMNWVPSYSFHSMFVPPNPTLAGTEIYTQGVLFSSDGKTYATNALDLRLGF